MDKTSAETATKADITGIRAILIVVGVSGSGKTTIATALAQRLGWPLEEGDALHPPASAELRSAHPLDDRNQWGWLEKVAAWIDGCRELGTGGVITKTPNDRARMERLLMEDLGFRLWRVLTNSIAIANACKFACA